MKLTVLEQVRYNDRNYREERETFSINKFDTFYNDINKEVGWGWAGLSILLLYDIINRFFPDYGWSLNLLNDGENITNTKKKHEKKEN